MRKAFFAFCALIVVVGIAGMIAFWYESRGRMFEIQNAQHFYTQMQLYEKSLIALSKTCLKKYGVAQCQNLEFLLGKYHAKIQMQTLEEKLIQVDILLELIHPLSGGIIRNNYRGFYIWMIFESVASIEAI